MAIFVLTYIFRGVWNYDFTLLKQSNIRNYFSDNVKPVCLPSFDQTFFGKNCWIAGFGRTNSRPVEYDSYLQDTAATVNRHCGAYGRYATPYYTTICVGYGGSTSGCNGDSGGPLVCESKYLLYQTEYLI